MLIIDDADRLRPITGSVLKKCDLCANRKATWESAKKDDPGGELVPMCGWCVLYAGSAWGHANRNEILVTGPTIRQAALARLPANPKVHVPELDERHRLPPLDAERLMLGVFFVSTKLPRRLGSIRRVAWVDED